MTKSRWITPTAAFIALTLGISPAHAAVSAPTMSSSGLQATKEALELPLLERISALRAQPHAYENLKSLMFAKSNSMDVRWKAVTAVGRIGSKAQAKADLVRALQASEWYMRNAALIAMVNVDRAESLKWARQLMSDKALVVRSAAVDVLAQSRDIASASLLWTKLNAKENYRGKQSLFIRRRIVEALAEMEGKGAEPKFVAVLGDKDASLHEPAIEALERLTKRSLGAPGEPVQFRRAQWQQWYKENKATL